MIATGENSTFENSGGYGPKIDRVITEAVKGWWNNLSKDELLQFIKEQPSITADNIRNMMANENSNLIFGVTFSTATEDACADFVGKNTRGN